jgi:histidinol-phosphate aminotransferase
VTLTAEQKQEFTERGFSRRSFGRLATLFAAGSTLPFYNEFSLAQELDNRRLPPGAVKIDTNENPLGPCREALEGMFDCVRSGGRYQFHLPVELQNTLAEVCGVKADHVQVYAGSSAPLHQAVLGFTSPTRPYVVADPGYEAGDRAAEFLGAKVVRVPLTKDYAHDVKAMLAGAPNGGLYYVCNPNNPTGTLTLRSDIEWLIANKPAGSVVLLDEAYIHFSDVPGMTDLVAAGKDVVILRTFSKLYGMAGLRAGAAIGRPDLLAKIRAYSHNFLPTVGMLGATVSLKQKNLVAERRKITRDVREDLFAFLQKNHFSFVPSVSNKFMLDVKRPGREVINALRKENVYVGRVWRVWPTHVRVTIGTQEEMNRFKTALLKVAGNHRSSGA